MAHLHLRLFSRVRDAAGLVRLRLTAHARHTWESTVTLDRAGLEEASCECYGITAQEHARLLGAENRCDDL